MSQVEINRKRELEITKMRKDLESAQNSLEMESESMRRRHQQTIAEMQDQIDFLTKAKNKSVFATVWCHSVENYLLKNNIMANKCMFVNAICYC